MLTLVSILIIISFILAAFINIWQKELFYSLWIICLLIFLSNIELAMRMKKVIDQQTDVLQTIIETEKEQKDG